MMKSYFADLDNNLKKIYDVANAARAKGFDPEKKVDIPVAHNMAERVEGLISAVAPQIVGKGMPERIMVLEKKYGILDWRISLIIAEEIAKEKFCKFDTKKEAIEIGIRVGFAYHTLGTVASPLEGFVDLDIKKTKDGKEYFALNYAGPIRSAGGTGGSVSVLIADYVRRKMGFAKYDPTENEIKRIVTELYDYHERVTNLQYLPSEQEIEFMIKNLPVQIDGSESTKITVSNYKDLERIHTNCIRGGMCLVIGECLCQKAPKLWKYLSRWKDEFEMDQWGFLEEFLEVADKAHAKVEEVKSDAKILPNHTFIKDMVAGRPVFTHPMRNGGFRLRYGRSRVSGYSNASISPATMYLVDDFLGYGTQIKVERPSKGATCSPCDCIDGPILKLNDGSVVRIRTLEEAKKYRSQLQEILYLGDILFPYGDFFDRNHLLVPAGYVEEWWVQEFEKAIVDTFGALDSEKAADLLSMDAEIVQGVLKDPFFFRISSEKAFTISKVFKIPLHPFYLYYWNTIKKDEFIKLISWLRSGKVVEEEGQIKKIIIRSYEGNKRSLELIGIPHLLVNNEYVVIKGEHARCLHYLNIFSAEDFMEGETPIEILSKISEVKIKDKNGTYVGARMGRPEKGKIRKLKGSPHGLFPVGEEGGKTRTFQNAIDKGKVYSDFPLWYCDKCDTQTIYPICEVCSSPTRQLHYCRTCGVLNNPCKTHQFDSTYSRRDIDVRHYFKSALKTLKTRVYPDLIKGVKGTSNREHIPENLIKGILRAKHGLTVNKDGTIRFDMSQLPITHFKAKEIHSSIEQLKELGYEKDINGKDLVDDDQIIEIKPQDLILPKNIGAESEGADAIFTRVTQFLDDLLVNMYGLDPYYNAKTSKDIIGTLFIVLAPHTSAGILGRVIGFYDGQGLLAHPYIHAATRRDCDGDEAGVMMVMDALLNFSRQYLPAHRGAKQDAPLVLTSKINPSEVDDMVFNVDIVWRYPLALYEAGEEYKTPYEIKIEQISSRLESDDPYSKHGYTHDVKDLNDCVLISAYKTLPSMSEKLDGQMGLALKIRAVDSPDVARLVIERHFIKDIKGNLRKFSMQKFRCVKCNAKYRRPPLIGRCEECGGKVIFTISKGFITKYLEPAINLANKYGVNDYLKQTIEIIKNRVDDVFGKETEKQEGLSKWF
jgi:DNA polymerase II large subunit